MLNANLKEPMKTYNKIIVFFEQQNRKDIFYCKKCLVALFEISYTSTMPGLSCPKKVVSELMEYQPTSIGLTGRVMVIMVPSPLRLSTLILPL